MGLFVEFPDDGTGVESSCVIYCLLKINGSSSCRTVDSDQKCPKIKEREVKIGGEERMKMKQKKRELVFKEEGQEYAQVIKMLGNGRLDALCFDGVKRLCHIRGKLRKKV